MASVCIYFIGIGMGYTKTQFGEKRWHVLFPFNECHSLKLNYAASNGKEGFLGHLAKRNTKIEIKVSDAESRTGKSANFTNHVLNLSVAHSGIKIIKDVWKNSGVLLTIENAVFGVYDKYLQEFPNIRDLDVYLVSGNEAKKQGLLAHTVSAHIDLGDDGEFKIEVNDEEIFSSEDDDTDVNYTLVFDNDCREYVEDKILKGDSPGDMAMFYKLFSETSGSTRRFELEGRRRTGPIPTVPAPDDYCQTPKFIDTIIITGPQPDLEHKKPCMFIQANEADDLP